MKQITSSWLYKIKNKKSCCFVRLFFKFSEKEIPRVKKKRSGDEITQIKGERGHTFSNWCRFRCICDKWKQTVQCTPHRWPGDLRVIVGLKFQKQFAAASEFWRQKVVRAHVPSWGVYRSLTADMQAIKTQANKEASHLKARWNLNVDCGY